MLNAHPRPNHFINQELIQKMARAVNAIARAIDLLKKNEIISEIRQTNSEQAQYFSSVLKLIENPSFMMQYSNYMKNAAKICLFVPTSEVIDMPQIGAHSSFNSLLCELFLFVNDFQSQHLMQSDREFFLASILSLKFLQAVAKDYNNKTNQFINFLDGHDVPSYSEISSQQANLTIEEIPLAFPSILTYQYQDQMSDLTDNTQVSENDRDGMANFTAPTLKK